MQHRLTNRQRRLATVTGLVVAAFLMATTGLVRAQDTEDAAAAQRYAQQDLRVNVWVDKSGNDVYQRGELMNVTFQTNEDAYVVVYRIDVDGKVLVLWPTSRYNDGFAFGNHEYRLPASGGSRLRTGDDEGVGYVQALASRYPFDLRGLEVDFQPETSSEPYDYYVNGDPFLAMNEVNYAITGLDDPGDFVVSNYASYYVHRAVDHPRYLCTQCHIDDGVVSDPYAQTCTVVIHHDYGWANAWWDRYHYYPVYYYPAYYYVDPWWGSPWVSYWYRPWYAWPYSFGIYDWHFACYDWRYSPYWHCDAYTASRSLPARYRPLDRSHVQRDGSLRDDGHIGSRFVTTKRPGAEAITAMKTRTDVRGGRSGSVRGDVRGGQVAAGGSRYENVQAVSRSQTRFVQSGEQASRAGLQVPRRSDGAAVRAGSTRSRSGSANPTTPSDRQRVLGPRVEPGTGEAGARAEASQRVRSNERSRQEDRGTIRTVEPRQGSVWSGRRSTPSRETAPTRPSQPSRGSSDRGSSQRSSSDSGSKVRSSGSSGRSSVGNSSGSSSSGSSSRGSSSGASRGSSGSSRGSSGSSRGSSGGSRGSSGSRGGHR